MENKDIIETMIRYENKFVNIDKGFESIQHCFNLVENDMSSAESRISALESAVKELQNGKNSAGNGLILLLISGAFLCIFAKKRKFLKNVEAVEDEKTAENE